jgi:NTE family protein
MALRSISLALQGGGVHGAFTWGALDRLLEEERLDIAAISATSAGALNAAALKAGMLRDGRAGARANLDWLWEQIGAIPNDALSAWFAAAGPDAGSISRAIEASPAYQWGEAVSRMVSPYQLPLPNPLRRIAERFDFDRVCAASPPSLHVCATNVRTGKVRVFAGAEITADAILASACLPTLFRAIEITDPATGIRDAYWDGGYTGNPALFPLFRPDLPDDLVIVNINPIERPGTPTTAAEILNRINEIGFNSSLLKELRAIAFVQRLLRDGHLAPGAMKGLHVHMIADDALMRQLSVATKTVPNPVVIARLKAAGRAAAEAFLDRCWCDLGSRDSIRLDDLYG